MGWACCCGPCMLTGSDRKSSGCATSMNTDGTCCIVLDTIEGCVRPLGMVQQVKVLVTKTN